MKKKKVGNKILSTGAGGFLSKAPQQSILRNILQSPFLTLRNP